MKLSAGSQCVKYLMFIFNLLFTITGIILLTIGLVVHGIYHNYEHFLDDKFFSAPSLLVAVGGIIFLIAFFGCVGAVRENYCMIRTFTWLLIVVFVLEVAAGVFGYTLRSRASTVVQEKMMDTMNKYNESAEIAYVWDQLQRDFDCCGTTNATDWTERWKSTAVPISCCQPRVGAIGTANCSLNSENLHHDGCYPKFLAFVKAHAVQLGAVGLSIAFVQAVGIWFSSHLARSIKNSYESV